MDVVLSKRKFVVVNGSKETEYDDPMPGAPITQVKKILAANHPEITSANIDEPNVEADGTLTYRFMATGGPHG